MTFEAALEASLNAPVERASPDQTEDIAGFPLGMPRAIVHPCSTEQVAAIIKIAREYGVPVVPVGARTAYWWPIEFDGAIALYTDKLLGRRSFDGIAILGAGEAVRPVDDWLRTQGFCLPIRPDAFGETSVGAMVASGLNAGIGMTRGGVDRWITGLTVVTGSGEVIRTGAAWARSDTTPFMRDGLPDFTGLFIGSEGTLGIVTEIAIQTPPTPWLVHVRAHAQHPGAMVAIGRDAARREMVDTARITRSWEPRNRGSPLQQPWIADFWTISSYTPSEAERRATWLSGALQSAMSTHIMIDPQIQETRAGKATAKPDSRWMGEMGQHDRFRQRCYLIGIEANAAHTAIDDLLALADKAVIAAHILKPLKIRTALYFTHNFVTLGIHASVDRTQPIAPWRAYQNQWTDAIAALPTIPYRPGRAWSAAARAHLDPTRLATLRQIRRLFDPDGILHPTHPLVNP